MHILVEPGFDPDHESRLGGLCEQGVLEYAIVTLTIPGLAHSLPCVSEYPQYNIETMTSTQSAL